MDDDAVPLDADELMLMGDRLEALPPADAEWVGRLYQECLRARMREAQLLESTAEADAPAVDSGNDFDTRLAQVALDALAAAGAENKKEEHHNAESTV